MMICLSSRSNNVCQLLVGKCTLHLNISGSCHELCRDCQPQFFENSYRPLNGMEFVRFVQSASKVELNNLSHIPYAHFLVGGACILFIPAIPDEFVCCGCAGNPAFQHRLP